LNQTVYMPRHAKQVLTDERTTDGRPANTSLSQLIVSGGG